MVLVTTMMDITSSISIDGVMEKEEDISMILEIVMYLNLNLTLLMVIVTSLLYVLNVISKELVSKWDKLMYRLILHSAQDPFVYQKDLKSEFGQTMDKVVLIYKEINSKLVEVSQFNIL